MPGSAHAELQLENERTNITKFSEPDLISESWGMVMLKKEAYLVLICMFFVSIPSYAEYHEASKEERATINAWHGEALRLKNAGKFDEAESLFFRIIKADPTNPHAHFDLGNVCLWKHKYAEAIKFYNRAIDLGLENQYLPAFHLNYAMCCIGLGNNEEAIKHLKQCLAIDPENKNAKGMLELVINAHGKKLELQPA